MEEEESWVFVRTLSNLVKSVIAYCLRGRLFESGNETGDHMATEPARWRIDLIVQSRVSLGDCVSTNLICHRVLSVEGVGRVLSC